MVVTGRRSVGVALPPPLPTVTFGGTEIDGGQDGCLEALAGVLKGACASKLFYERSGPADLQIFDPNSGRWGSRRSSGLGGRTKDPEYLTAEQRQLIGFAGELAAYNYLRVRVKGFTDHCWLSSMGRRHLGLPPEGDDEGFDFRIPRSRSPLFYEVKAHVGDPGFVDLERSQVAAAVSMAAERRGRWRILYVSHVRDPELITVSELPNPFSESGRVFFREDRNRAVRLKIRRSDDFSPWADRSAT